MGTLLTNPRMNPALAARVRASLRRGRSRGSRVGTRWTAVLRLVALAGIGVALISLSALRRQENEQLERARTSLLDAVRLKRAQLSTEDMQTLDRTMTVLLHAPGPYEGDYMTGEARGVEALSALLTRPIVYVRGPIDAFMNEDAILRAALVSAPDAFIRCLVDPPRMRTEKALLERIRAGSGPEAPEPRVHRLYHLLSGVPLLQTPFKVRVRAATKLRELSQMESELHLAKLEETIAAARARLLLFVMDEPSPPGGPTELDGERARDVRVTLFDLEHHQPILRLRRHVDPSSFSDRGRAGHAASLDACALSSDVREAAAKVAQAD